MLYIYSNFFHWVFVFWLLIVGNSSLYNTLFGFVKNDWAVCARLVNMNYKPIKVFADCAHLAYCHAM